MNQVATKEQIERKATPVEAYASQVIGDDARAADLYRALPGHIPPARFQRNLVNLLMQKPEMLRYEPRLVYREVSKAAALGLMLDPQLGEGYIVPVWNAKAGRSEPELRCGYRGLIKLARQSGDIANIYPGEVRENDHFLADEGTERRLEHQPDYRRPRGDPDCYYAVVIYKDGTKDFEVMDMDSIFEVREKSDAWRAFQAGKIKSTPWATDQGEMCKKTVLRRLLKRVPQSPDLADALSLENDRPPVNLIEVPKHGERSEPPKSIEARLDKFAGADDENSGSAAPASQEPEAPEAARHPASEESALSEAQPSPAEDSADSPDEPPAKIADAMERGRAARRAGYTREVPRAYKYKSRQEEADAFLRGWDEEEFEIRAEENGSV